MPRDCDAFIGLGSNRGDRVALLRAAVRALRRVPGVRVTGVSPVYRSGPVADRPGMAGQPEFLNAAVRARTPLAAGPLVRALLAVERSLGRRRGRSARRVPRLLDLDLLLLGDTVSPAHRATVPHPRLHARAFALRSVLDLAPAARHPVLGTPLKDLLAPLARRQRITRASVPVQRQFRNHLP